MSPVELLIYTDAGVRKHQHREQRRGVAVFIVVKDDREIARRQTELGNITIGKAEYLAVVEALRWLEGQREITGEVELRSDSEFLVRQVSGEYKVLDPEIKYLYDDVMRLKDLLRHRGILVRFVHIRRGQNLAGKVLENQHS